MKKKKDILAIDDEQVILDSIEKLCSAEDIAVETAIDAFSALDKLDKQEYELIICDIMMPEVDGFEFLERMHTKGIDTPFLITTGYSTMENAVKSLYVGAVDFLPKPFTVDELLSCVTRGLRYARIKQAILRDGVEDHTSVHYVPCPAKYKRLGYSSWLVTDDDGSVRVGISDLFLQTISSVQTIELSQTDEEVVQGSPCARLFTDDQLVHNILSPVSGRIIRRNEKLETDLPILEKDPYFEGWLYRIIPSDPDYELKHLIPCSSENL